MPLRPPLTITSQVPAPWKNSIAARMTGRWPGWATWLSVVKPNPFHRKSTGLWPGFRMNSQSMKLATPASAPGM